MAYAAVISLKETIYRLLNSSRISIVSPNREILEFAYKEVDSLQEVLKRLDGSRNSSEKMKALEGQIREAVCKLEDVLESHVSDQFLAQSESIFGVCNERHPLLFSLNLQELRQDFDCFTQMAEKMEEEYLEKLDNPLSAEGEEEEEEEDVVSSRNDFGGNYKSTMVGLADQFREVRDHLLGDHYTTQKFSIVGMAGIGKTTLAKKLFEDPLILRNFACRAFVTLGPNYQLKEMKRAILDQVNPDSNKIPMEEDELYKCLRKSLEGRRYLIVLDDVWDLNFDFWHGFIIELTYGGSGSWVLLTTRLKQVTKSINSWLTHKMRFLNKEESWDLLRGKVFDEEVCPSQLEKAGKKIAENCEGLPLLIVTVAELLSKAEKTPQYWNKVAADKRNSIFVDAYDQILKVLYPSYNYLPQHLKACFLYMGAFPQDYEVRLSKLVNMWAVEGFLETYDYQYFRSLVKECIKYLVSSYLVLVRKRGYSHKLKAYSLHSVFWHLCKREARNDKFLHILNSYEDGLAEGIESHRRLSIYKNILFGINDVRNSMASISTARSLICTGAYHQYQVPICVGLRLLRVLDALTIRFYEFPIEVLKLIRLRYLALSYNRNLPPSISKLWNLEYLIVHQHLSIKSTVAQSLYVPVEIWDLQELKYLQIMGRNLPDPPSGAVLPKLLTLLDVGIYSCTKSVLESIPNLKKLRVQIELAPDAAEPMSYFDRVPLNKKLYSLKCIVGNPELRPYEVVAPPLPLSAFTYWVKKLTLRGFGCPWQDMNNIAALPYLRVLKLQCYAFRGEKWNAEERRFQNLRRLSIEDADLVQWTVGENSLETFPNLVCLTFRNCYKLQEIPYILTLEKIELVDCNLSAVSCAQQMIRPYREVYIYSSWDEENVKP